MLNDANYRPLCYWSNCWDKQDWLMARHSRVGGEKYFLLCILKYFWFCWVHYNNWKRIFLFIVQKSQDATNSPNENIVFIIIMLILKIFLISCESLAEEETSPESSKIKQLSLIQTRNYLNRKKENFQVYGKMPPKVST